MVLVCQVLRHLWFSCPGQGDEGRVTPFLSSEFFPSACGPHPMQWSYWNYTETHSPGSLYLSRPLVLSPQSSLHRPSRHIETEQSLTCYGARTSHCNSPLPAFPTTTELSSHFFVLMDPSAMLLSQNKTSFFSGYRGLCIAVFTPSWCLGTWEVFAGSGGRVRRSCLGSCGLRAWPAPEGGTPPEPRAQIPCWGARWCQQTARQAPWCLERTDPYQRYEVPY